MSFAKENPILCNSYSGAILFSKYYINVPKNNIVATTGKPVRNNHKFPFWIPCRTISVPISCVTRAKSKKFLHARCCLPTHYMRGEEKRPNTIWKWSRETMAVNPFPNQARKLIYPMIFQPFIINSEYFSLQNNCKKHVLLVSSFLIFLNFVFLQYPSWKTYTCYSFHPFQWKFWILFISSFLCQFPFFFVFILLFPNSYYFFKERGPTYFICNIHVNWKKEVLI